MRRHEPLSPRQRPRTLAARVALLVASAIVVVAVACAQPGAPPGGPPDAELPVLLKVLPESNAVNVRTPAVVLQFDEVINERSNSAGGQSTGGGQGSGVANTLGNVLVISPSDGRDEVIWRRTALELRPRRGFRPNTTYRVTINPGLADLRGNRTTVPFDFVFSTGPTTASGELRGVFFDWTTGRVAPNARIELFREGDTTFRWIARSDSGGRFVVRDLDAGSYELRGWVDANNDRRISFREVSEAMRVAFSDTASVELYAFLRDTLPPRIEGVDLLDSTGLRVRFDRGLVADWDGAGVSLFGPDSTLLPLGGAMIPSARYDSLASARRAARDSAAKANDTSATDTSAAGATRDARRPQRPVVAPPVVEDSAAIDSLPPAPIFRRKVPETSWSVPLSSPLAPGAYRLRIVGPPGLNGRTVNAEREFRVRPPLPPSDSTKATGDRPRPAADSTKPPATRTRP
jgi:hypothetical protein